ncbi:ribosome silencing factor [Shewanella sp. YIC-542]|uniref:ribosome silencing factor n=1 Tax=Shewanella mytili TaxID=3377111 RepID=UPI00398F77F9
MQSAELKQFVVDKVEDIKAKDVVVLDVQQKSNVTDYMVVCTGTSQTHISAIAQHVIGEAKQAGLLPLGVEGRDSSDWVLVDLGNVILHVMLAQAREHYQLEKLWTEV